MSDDASAMSSFRTDDKFDSKDTSDSSVRISWRSDFHFKISRSRNSGRQIVWWADSPWARDVPASPLNQRFRQFDLNRKLLMYVQLMPSVPHMLALEQKSLGELRCEKNNPTSRSSCSLFGSPLGFWSYFDLYPQAQVFTLPLNSVASRKVVGRRKIWDSADCHFLKPSSYKFCLEQTRSI